MGVIASTIPRDLTNSAAISLICNQDLVIVVDEFAIPRFRVTETKLPVSRNQPCIASLALPSPVTRGFQLFLDSVDLRSMTARKPF